VHCCNSNNNPALFALLMNSQSVDAEHAVDQAADAKAPFRSNKELDEIAACAADLSQPSVEFAAFETQDAVTCSRGVARLHKGNSLASGCSRRASGGPKAPHFGVEAETSFIRDDQAGVSRCSQRVSGGPKHQTLVWRHRSYR